LKIGYLEKDHGFVVRRIGLYSLPLEAYKRRTTVELNVMAGFFVTNGEAKRVLIEALCRIKFIEVKLDSSEPQLSFRHSAPPSVLYLIGRYPTFLRRDCRQFSI